MFLHLKEEYKFDSLLSSKVVWFINSHLFTCSHHLSFSFSPTRSRIFSRSWGPWEEPATTRTSASWQTGSGSSVLPGPYYFSLWHLQPFEKNFTIKLYLLQGVIISPPCCLTPPSMRLPPPRMTRRSWRPSLIWTRCWIFLCQPLMKASTSRPPLMLRATSLTRWEFDIDIWAHFFFTFLTIETKSFDYVLWKLS